MPKYRQGLTKMRGTWHFRICVQGRVHKGDTGQTDRGEAAEVLRNFRVSLRVHLATGAVPTPTLSDLVKDWAEVRGPVLAVKTVKDAQRALERDVLPTLGAIPIDKLTPAHFSKLQAEFMGRTTRRGRAPSLHSLAYLMTTLRTLLNWAVSMGHLSVAPKVPAVRPPRRPKVWLAPELVQQFLDAIDARGNVPVSAAARVLLFCGLREGEMLRMRYSRLAGEDYTVPDAKDGEPRVVPVPAEVRTWIDKLDRNEGEDLVFPGHTTGWLKKPLAAVGEKLGLAGTLTNHRLRGSYATLLAQTGSADASTIQDLLGHSSFQTTRLYIEASGTDQKRAATTRLMEALTGLPKKPVPHLYRKGRAEGANKAKKGT